MENREKFYGIENYLSEMIKIPTVSAPTYKNQYKISEYKDFLKKTFGALFQKAEITEIGEAMILWLKSENQEESPVLFVGHMDVVPAEEGGQWEHEPFSGKIENNCIWGRGSQDMKGPQCALLSALDVLLKEGKKIRQDIFLYFSCDEEIGGKTTEQAVGWFKEKKIFFKGVFDEGGTICENFMGLIPGKAAMIGIGEKGSLVYKFTAKGEGGHAANPPKEGALFNIIELIRYIHCTNIFKKGLTRGGQLMLKKIAEINPEKREDLFAVLESGDDYTKLYDLTGEAENLLGATIAFTKISGGTAFNVIPKEIEVLANVRVSAIQKEKEITPILKGIGKKFKVECELIEGSDGAVETYIDRWAYRSMASAVQKVYENIPAIPFVLGGGTDSKHFQELTKETIRFSPMYASPEQGRGVHGENEYAYVQALADAACCYYTFIKEYL